jgi:hypothetical protein
MAAGYHHTKGSPQQGGALLCQTLREIAGQAGPGAPEATSSGNSTIAPLFPQSLRPTRRFRSTTRLGPVDRLGRSTTLKDQSARLQAGLLLAPFSRAPPRRPDHHGRGRARCHLDRGADREGQSIGDSSMAAAAVVVLDWKPVHTGLF